MIADAGAPGNGVTLPIFFDRCFGQRQRATAENASRGCKLPLPGHAKKTVLFRSTVFFWLSVGRLPEPGARVGGVPCIVGGRFGRGGQDLLPPHPVSRPSSGGTAGKRTIRPRCQLATGPDRFCRGIGYRRHLRRLPLPFVRASAVFAPASAAFCSDYRFAPAPVAFCAGIRRLLRRLPFCAGFRRFLRRHPPPFAVAIALRWLPSLSTLASTVFCAGIRRLLRRMPFCGGLGSVVA